MSVTGRSRILFLKYQVCEYVSDTSFHQIPAMDRNCQRHTNHVYCTLSSENASSWHLVASVPPTGRNCQRQTHHVKCRVCKYTADVCRFDFTGHWELPVHVYYTLPVGYESTYSGYSERCSYGFKIGMSVLDSNPSRGTFLKHLFQVVEFLLIIVMDGRYD